MMTKSMVAMIVAYILLLCSCGDAPMEQNQFTNTGTLIQSINEDDCAEGETIYEEDDGTYSVVTTCNGEMQRLANFYYHSDAIKFIESIHD